MNKTLLEKLDALLPLLVASVRPLEENKLYMLCGWEFFSGSGKGVSAYSALREIIIRHGEDYVRNRTLIDASSGNFGRALAMLCDYLGLKCELVVGMKGPESARDYLRTLCKLHVLNGPTLECYEHAKEIVENKPGKYIMVGQLDNWDNPLGHYEFTGPQILAGCPDIAELYMAMGSGGGMHGTVRYLLEHRPQLKVFVSTATPESSITGTFNAAKDYKTPFIIDAEEKGWISEQMQVTEDQTTDGMIAMAKEYGAWVGWSSGGVYEIYSRRRADGLATGKAVLALWDSAQGWTQKCPSAH